MAGTSTNTSKVKTAFVIYFTYLNTEQIFYGEGDCVTLR